MDCYYDDCQTWNAMVLDEVIIIDQTLESWKINVIPMLLLLFRLLIIMVLLLQQQQFPQ